MNSTEKEIFDMYIKEKVGCDKGNEYCKHCQHNKKLAGPVSFFHIGSLFKKDKYKIVFVGKNSWYDKDGYQEERYAKGCFADARETGRDSINGFGKYKINSPYWGYIRHITEKLYGNIRDGVEHIAVTNIVKCNTTGEKDDYADDTPNDIINNCINFGIFEKEIQIMKPKHIIFLTGIDYDEAIENFNFGCSKIIEGRKTRLDNGKIVRWTRKLYHNGKLKYSVLRTSHPQYKNKKIFTRNIIDWIKATETR